MYLKYIIPIVAAAVLSGCNQGRTYSSSTVFTERAKLAEVSENFVKVSVSLETDPVGKHVIRTTFTPADQGLHLYSKDMPEDGVKGLGRPTRMYVTGDVIKPAGPVFSDAVAQNVDGLPVYPDGPVTLRQPIEIIGGAKSTAQIEVTYMACRTGGECKIPVERKRVDLKLPSN
jgi:hypothetical protein